MSKVYHVRVLILIWAVGCFTITTLTITNRSIFGYTQNGISVRDILSIVTGIIMFVVFIVWTKYLFDPDFGLYGMSVAIGALPNKTEPLTKPSQYDNGRSQTMPSGSFTSCKSIPPLHMPQISVQPSHTWTHASYVDPYTF